MRTNLTKKEIINSIYMQIGFTKKIFQDAGDLVHNSIAYHRRRPRGSRADADAQAQE